MMWTLIGVGVVVVILLGWRWFRHRWIEQDRAVRDYGSGE